VQWGRTRNLVKLGTRLSIQMNR